MAESLAKQALCVDLDSAYISGEPGSHSEASIVLGYEFHPEVVLSWRDPGYDNHSFWYFTSRTNNPWLYITYNQLQVRTGTYKRVKRTFAAHSQHNFELSLNYFVDKNDYIGLIHSSPDPQSILTINGLGQGVSAFENKFKEWQ